MSHIAVEQIIDAPVAAVWDYIAAVDRHVEWMADAETITFLGDQQSGVGTRMAVLTRIGPFTTTDVMEFTEWDPPARMAIRHDGLVTGEGAFSLEPIDEGRTRFRWEEDLTFPARFGGAATAWFAAPVLRLVWRRNLKRLADRF